MCFSIGHQLNGGMVGHGKDLKAPFPGMKRGHAINIFNEVLKPDGGINRRNTLRIGDHNRILQPIFCPIPLLFSEKAPPA